MAAEDKKPPSLDAFFKGKAKKKPKAMNLNAEKPPEPEPAPKREPAAAAATAESEGWERALRRDQDLLKLCGLWIKEVEADGACLFRAFADQIEGDGGTAHASYRERCVDFLQANRADFEPFLEEDFTTYCGRMREPATWGGHVEAQALARALGVNAMIYCPAEARGSADRLTSTAVEITNLEAADARCVQLSFHPTHHAGQHYNSVRCTIDDGSGPSPAMSVTELRRSIDEALHPAKPSPTEEAAAAPKAKPKGSSAKVF